MTSQFKIILSMKKSCSHILQVRWTGSWYTYWCWKKVDAPLHLHVGA